MAEEGPADMATALDDVDAMASNASANEGLDAQALSYENEMRLVEEWRGIATDLAKTKSVLEKMMKGTEKGVGAQIEQSVTKLDAVREEMAFYKPLESAGASNAFAPSMPGRTEASGSGSTSKAVFAPLTL